MNTIADLIKSTWRARILAYGVSGVGKTTFAASMAKHFGEERTLVINFDQEYNLWPFASAGLHKVNYITYKEGDYDKVLKQIVDLRRMDPFPYDLVVIENLAGLHRVIFDQILRAAGRSDSDGARIQDWGLAAERVKVRLKEYMTLPCHILVTAHEQIERDEISGKVVGRILIAGKHLPDEIPPMFNLFFHMVAQPTADKKHPKRVIHTGPDLMFPAGDKSGALEFVEDPDFPKLWTKVSTKIKGVQDAKA